MCFTCGVVSSAGFGVAVLIQRQDFDDAADGDHAAPRYVDRMIAFIVYRDLCAFERGSSLRNGVLIRCRELILTVLHSEHVSRQRVHAVLRDENHINEVIRIRRLRAC